MARASSLVDGVSPSWFARFQQLSCRKALIYGELSLPAQEADDVAAGIPLLVVPDAGHSMAWENPVALADCMAQFSSRLRQTPRYRSEAFACLRRWQATRCACRWRSLAVEPRYLLA
jgi:hypothetical protein